MRTDRPAPDLFTPVVPPEQWSVEFQRILAQKTWQSGRDLINEIFRMMKGAEKHFVREFQSTGTDARTWELFLTAAFSELGFEIDKIERPDFLLTKGSQKVYVEATVSQPSFGAPKPDLFAPREDDHKENGEREFAIRVGGALYSKLKKEYWKTCNLGNSPLVFAVAAFHSNEAFHFADAHLVRYLYAAKAEFFFDEDGALVVTSSELTEHVHNQKRIPSGYFNLPGAENVSAVFFNNTGTLPKFQRMAFQESPPDDILILRCGSCYSHDPNETEPLGFLYKVGDRSFYREHWNQGSVMMHNPNAIHPLDPDLFPGIVHYFGPHDTLVPKNAFLPFESKTFPLIGKGVGALPVRSRFMTKAEVIEVAQALFKYALGAETLEALAKFVFLGIQD